MRQILQEVQMLILASANVGAMTPVTGATFDTQGFDSIMVNATIGAMAAGATATLKLQGGNAADGSDKADIAGASQTAIAATGVNKYVSVEIHRPISRYITPVLTRAVANSDVLSIEAALAGASSVPVAQPHVSGNVALVSPPFA